MPTLSVGWTRSRVPTSEVCKPAPLRGLTTSGAGIGEIIGETILLPNRPFPAREGEIIIDEPVTGVAAAAVCTGVLGQARDATVGDVWAIRERRGGTNGAGSLGLRVIETRVLTVPVPVDFVERLSTVVVEPLRPTAVASEATDEFEFITVKIRTIYDWAISELSVMGFE